MTKLAEQCLRCGNANTEQFQHCPTCGFPLILLAGKYQLEQELSRGGMGQLYLARHIHLTERPERVIKVIHPKFLGAQKAVQRFHREVQVTALLSHDNEHIVRVYDDFGEEEGLGHYYVMEYLQGRTLTQIMPQGYGMPLRLALHLFSQLTEALALAHQQSIVHRDLKPDNIFLIQRKQDPHFVKIIDFGIARFASSKGAGNLTHDSLGTPAYMSPEQCANEPVDGRSDIYALALIFYEILSGHYPYASDASARDNMPPFQLLTAHLTKEVIPLSDRNPDYQELSVVLQKAMAKQPEDRYLTMQDFAEAVVAASEGVSSRPVRITAHNAKPLPTPSSGEQPPLKRPTQVAPAQQNPAEETASVIQAAGLRTQHLRSRWLWALGAFVTGCIAIFFVSNPSLLQPTKPATHQPIPTRLQKLPAKRPQQRVEPPQRPSQARPSSPKPEERPKARTLRRKKRLSRKKPQHPFRRKRSRRFQHKKAPRKREPQRKRSRPAITKARPKPKAQDPCGLSSDSHRWVHGYLLYPHANKANIEFASCKSCKVKQVNTHYCIQVPTKKRVKIHVSASGYQLCTHWLVPSQRKVRWKLRLETITELADDSYQCTQ